MFGQQVGGVLVLECAGHHVALRQTAPAQSHLELLDAGGRECRPVEFLVVEHRGEPGHDLGQIVTVDHLPARAVRQSEVLRNRRVREDDHVIPAQPALRPAGVVLDEGPQRIAGLPGLAHR